MMLKKVNLKNNFPNVHTIRAVKWVHGIRGRSSPSSEGNARLENGSGYKRNLSFLYLRKLTYLYYRW